MITCPKCNKELEDGTQFCDSCGTSVAKATDEAVDQPAETPVAEAPAAETPAAETPAAETPAAPQQNAVPQPEAKKNAPKISPKIIGIAGAAVAVILVIAIVLPLIIGGLNSGKELKYALYLKDDEMFYTSTSKIKPMQITDNLIDGSDELEDEISDAGYSIGMFTYLCDDGKTLFYVDKIDDDSEGANLYVRNISNTKKEPTKIDSDVTSYAVTPKGDTVYYLKGEDGTLYVHDLKDKEKIASDVEYFSLSEDGKTIVYADDEENVYLKKAGEDKEKVDSEITNIEYYSDDFKTIYYSKEDSIYKKVAGKDKEKIASDIYYVIAVYESGEAYYLKSDSEELTLADFVEDDMKEADATIEYPEYPDSPEYPDYPDRPYRYEYDTYDEYEEAYEKYEQEYEKCEQEYEQAYDEYYDLLDEYYDNIDLYEEKQERDELREALKEETVTNPTYSLYYFNGKEEKLLTDAYAASEYGLNCTSAAEAPVVVFSIRSEGEAPSIKLSEIDYVSDVTYRLSEVLNGGSEMNIAVKDTVTEIEDDESFSYRISDDGSTIYFLDGVADDEDEEDEDDGDEDIAELYKMTVSKNKVSKPVLYDTDVYRYYYYLLEDGKIMYFKEINEDSEGELYIDKNKIDYDVYAGRTQYIAESETVVYMTDWDSEDYTGTLKSFKKKDPVKIADDVSSYFVTPSEDVLYINDFSDKYSKGTLHIFKGKKSEKIDDDVSAIVPIYDSSDSRMRGNY